MLRGTGYSTGRRGRFDAAEGQVQNGLTQVLFPSLMS